MTPLFTQSEKQGSYKAPRVGYDMASHFPSDFSTYNFQWLTLGQPHLPQHHLPSDTCIWPLCFKSLLPPPSDVLYYFSYSCLFLMYNFMDDGCSVPTRISPCWGQKLSVFSAHWCFLAQRTLLGIEEVFHEDVLIQWIRGLKIEYFCGKMFS